MRRRRIHEGKAKVLFEGPEPGTLVQYFKDDATAFNNQKRGTITGKGVLNNPSGGLSAPDPPPLALFRPLSLAIQEAT